MLQIFDHYHVNIINTIVQIWIYINKNNQISALLQQGCIKLVRTDSEKFNIVKN